MYIIRKNQPNMPYHQHKYLILKLMQSNCAEKTGIKPTAPLSKRLLFIDS